ncbi:DUF2235 domain-containing protein [Pollutimonas bauzanensis]|uniref:phospholipase effector Tle1 domain-containing protein n=1 Tax=Pollutimonas bauzanensis TaxID=658167 RepID=UPI003342C7FF
MLQTFCLLLLLLAAPLSALSQSTSNCGPSPLGQPCAEGGLAVAPTAEPSLNLGVGNPIHIVTGNKYQEEIDLPANPGAPGIEIVRHYNSLDTRASHLGPGWSLSYDTRLFYAGATWQIVQADGSRIHFSGPRHAPLPGPQGALKKGGEHWIWTWPTGRQLWFDASGYLVRLLAGSQTQLEIQRNQQIGPLMGSITSISNQQGHTLLFAYSVAGDHAYLRHIDSPLGRIQYQHEDIGDAVSAGARRLVGMTRPDGMQRRYLYEPERQNGNVTALTGAVTVSADQQDNLRTNTWAYDREGRAVLSIRNGSDSQADTVSIEYIRPPTHAKDGLTVVTDGRQQQTRFETAIRGSRHVLTRVTGAGCAGCAAPGSHASYDEQGRLQAINGTHIHRYPNGAIHQLKPHGVGWPGLSLTYQPDAHRAAWASTLTGTERVLYNAQSLPARRIWANGDSVDYQYDAQGRPIRILEKNSLSTQKTDLQWRGHLLTRITHPNETESRQYDNLGRLSQRKVERLSAHATTSLNYTESFGYDSNHRLARHDLPEGGALMFSWDTNNRLAGIDWHDAHGQVHTVISSRPGLAGYCYGNGLCLTTELDDEGQARRLAVTNGAETVWFQHQDYDRHRRPVREHHEINTEQHNDSWAYAYDDRSRLIGAQGRLAPGTSQGAKSDTIWYAWNDDGSLAANRSNGATVKPSIQRDGSGLPLSIDGIELEYGPDRRPAVVRQQGQRLASYAHNAFGHRIIQRSGHANTDYFYLNNQLVAEANGSAKRSPHEGDSAPDITRRYIYANHVVVGFIDYPASSTAPAQLYAVHADLIGAPRMITDATRKIRWLARYSPTGAAQRISGDLTFDLRLPGQVFDAATGWHDNLLRTYLPQSGHYLEPDPLGPVPGNQALGYANQQPRRYVDPLGLLLFAFDGTRNNPETRSNVWKLSQTYQDGPVFYHPGPGNALYLDWDAVTASSASRIIETQWQSLLQTLKQSGNRRNHLPIDILGYSRGAALARHFGNMINQHVNNGLFSYTDSLHGLITACVDLRFMGLFDTVAQFGVAGSQNANYDLTIAPAWEWVAHAVALHERRWLFPLVSAEDSGGQNVVEAPFIGAHADIGGGSLLDDDSQPIKQGDLADVALNWMLWQARAASVRFDNGSPSDREISGPIVHDERSALLRSVQDGDRSVQSGSGSLLNNYQNDHEQLGASQRTETEALIIRADNWRSSANSQVGVVDMTGYAQWLHDELGWQA